MTLHYRDVPSPDLGMLLNFGIELSIQLCLRDYKKLSNSEVFWSSGRKFLKHKIQSLLSKMHIAFLVFFLLCADFAQSQPSPSKKKLQVSNKCMYHIFRHLNFRQKLFLTRNISMGSRVIFSQFTSVTGRAVWNVVLTVLAFVFSFTCWVVTGMDSCAHCTIDQELFSYSRSWRSSFWMNQLRNISTRICEV